MKRLLFIVSVIALVLSACEKVSEMTVSPTTEKRGQPNNGGNGNQNGPCSGYVTYPYVSAPPSNWHITADTSLCGMVIIRWDAQQGFTSTVDSCNSLLGKYFISISPVVYDPISSGCAGTYSTTPVYYYTYGAGCSMWGGAREYDVRIQWYQKVDSLQQIIDRTSLVGRIRTGTKMTWQCN